jgi:hypothetical protein
MTHPRLLELQAEIREKMTELQRIRLGMVWQAEDERALADTALYVKTILEEVKELAQEMQRLVAPPA